MSNGFFLQCKLHFELKMKPLQISITVYIIVFYPHQFVWWRAYYMYHTSIWLMDKRTSKICYLRKVHCGTHVDSFIFRMISDNKCSKCQRYTKPYRQKHTTTFVDQNPYSTYSPMQKKQFFQNSFPSVHQMIMNDNLNFWYIKNAYMYF